MTHPNWRNFWSVLVAGLLLFRSPCGLAEEHTVTCDPDDPDLCSKPMKKGEPAPFDGQLLSTELSISLGQKAASFEARLKIELKSARGEMQLRIDFEKYRLKVYQEASEKQVKLLTLRLKEATQQVWYEHPAFIISCTIVVTVLIFVATAYLIQAVQDDDI